MYQLYLKRGRSYILPLLTQVSVSPSSSNSSISVSVFCLFWVVFTGSSVEEASSEGTERYLSIQYALEQKPYWSLMFTHRNIHCLIVIVCSHGNQWKSLFLNDVSLWSNVVLQWKDIKVMHLQLEHLCKTWKTRPRPPTQKPLSLIRKWNIFQTAFI